MGLERKGRNGVVNKGQEGRAMKWKGWTGQESYEADRSGEDRNARDWRGWIGGERCVADWIVTK